MERSPPATICLYTRDGRRKYVTPAERDRTIVEATRWHRPEVGTLCLFLAFTGCRISEALAVRVSQIDRAEKFVAIVSLKKRGKIVVREIPLPDDLLDRLEGVHHLLAGGDRRLWSWSRGRAWLLIKELMLSAAVAPGAHCTAKGLRHGFGIQGVRSGVPLNIIQRWLGHANIATTAIYAEALGEEERALAARMWQASPPIRMTARLQGSTIQSQK